jgi:hypothetical protein
MGGTDIEPRTCFACGRSYINTPAENKSFCSTNCQEQYDAGFRITWRDQRDQPALHLPDGIMLTCPGCNRQFRSRGLGFCSEKCIKDYDRRSAANAELAQIREATGVSLPKRGKPCQGPGCSTILPPWTAKGQNRAKFCSPKCGRNARRDREAGNHPDVAEVGAEVPAAQGVAEPDPVT